MLPDDEPSAVPADGRRVDDEGLFGKRMRIVVFADLGGAPAAAGGQADPSDEQHQQQSFAARNEMRRHHSDSTCFDAHEQRSGLYPATPYGAFLDFLRILSDGPAVHTRTVCADTKL